jgi:hypothetical protein
LAAYNIDLAVINSSSSVIPGGWHGTLRRPTNSLRIFKDTILVVAPPSPKNVYLVVYSCGKLTDGILGY